MEQGLALRVREDRGRRRCGRGAIAGAKSLSGARGGFILARRALVGQRRSRGSCHSARTRQRHKRFPWLFSLSPRASGGGGHGQLSLTLPTSRDPQPPSGTCPPALPSTGRGTEHRGVANVGKGRCELMGRGGVTGWKTGDGQTSRYASRPRQPRRPPACLGLESLRIEKRKVRDVKRLDVHRLGLGRRRTCRRPEPAPRSVPVAGNVRACVWRNCRIVNCNHF